MFNPLQLNCPHCGSVLQAKDSSDQGKDVRCPKCQTNFVLELSDREPGDATPRTQLTGSRPAGRRFRPSGLTIILGLLVIGTAGVVAGLFHHPAPVSTVVPLDLSYLPPESDLVACVKVAELMRSPLLADVIANPATQAALTLVATQSGISPRQIESVTLGAVLKQQISSPLPELVPPAPQQSYGVLVIRSIDPLDVEAIAVKSLKGTRQTHSGTTYFKLPVPIGPGFVSCYFPQTNVAVVALEQNLIELIDRGPTSVTPRIPDFDFVKSDRTCVLALTSKAIDINPTHPTLAPSGNLQLLETELKQNFRTAAVGISVTDRLSTDVVINCADRSGAVRIQRAMELNVTDLKALLKRQQNWLNLSGMSDVGALAESSVNSISIIQTGEEVQAQAAIPEELKAIAAKYATGFTALMPTGPGIGGPRPAPTLPAIPNWLPGFIPGTK